MGTHTAYYRNGKLRKKTRYTVSETKRRPPDLKPITTGTIQRSGTLKINERRACGGGLIARASRLNRPTTGRAGAARSL